MCSPALFGFAFRMLEAIAPPSVDGLLKFIDIFECGVSSSSPPNDVMYVI